MAPSLKYPTMLISILATRSQRHLIVRVLMHW